MTAAAAVAWQRYGDVHFKFWNNPAAAGWSNAAPAHTAQKYVTDPPAAEARGPTGANGGASGAENRLAATVAMFYQQLMQLKQLKQRECLQSLHRHHTRRLILNLAKL